MPHLVRKTKRLIIRPLELKDFAAWKKAHLTMLKPQNTWDLGAKSGQELTKANYKKIIKNQQILRKKDLFYDLCVFDKDKNFVGTVGIMEVARRLSQTSYLGYRIFNNYWGKGYAKEAAAAAIDIAFKDLKLHRIEAGIEPENIRSIRLAKSLKMRKEGLKKRALFLRGKWVDLIMYTLTTEDVGLKFNSKNIKAKART